MPLPLLLRVLYNMCHRLLASLALHEIARGRTTARKAPRQQSPLPVHLDVCRAEVAGRLYRASYRHMAHFTLLLILFAAAAYKSEVGRACIPGSSSALMGAAGFGGMCCVLRRGFAIVLLLLLVPWAATGYRVDRCGGAAQHQCVHFARQWHILFRRGQAAGSPYPNPLLLRRLLPIPMQHTAFMALTLLSEVNSVCHLTRKMLGTAASASGAAGTSASAAAEALAAADRVTFAAFRCG